MPIRLVKIKGMKGYRYGSTGKFYPIKEYGEEEAYNKSLKQAQAIKSSEERNIDVKSSKRAKGYRRQL